MQKQVLTLMVLILTAQAACPASSNINNILADSVTFTVNGNSSVTQQTYNYQYQTQFSSLPSLALAIQNFALNFAGPHSFIVSPQAITTTNNQFIFSFTPTVWSSITINFFVSSNPQLQLGYLTVSPLQFGNNSCEGCALVYGNLRTAFGQNQNPVIRVFLNGFTLDARSSALQVSVSPTNLQDTKLTFRVTLGKTTVLNSIALSWLAFSPSSASFASYGGQINQNQYSGSVSSDISSSIYQSQYTIYGLTLLSINSGKGINFGANIDTNFIITIGSSIPIDSFSLVYVALGQLPSKQCQNCGAANIINSGFCYSECPANTYSFTYNDGGVGCRSCSNKLGLILVNGKCVAGSSTTTTTVITQTIANAQPAPTANANTASSNTVSTNSPSSSSVSASANTQSSTSSQIANTTVINPPRRIVPAITPSLTPTPSTTNVTPTVVPASMPPTPTPVVPSVPVATPVVTPQISTVSINCPANAYYNGNECVCQVGYVFVNGVCSASKSSVSVPVIITYPTNRKACNFTNNDASSSSTTNNNNIPAGNNNSTVTPTPSNNNTGTNTNNTTNTTPTRPVTPTPSSGCPANSYDNGLGVCVCNTGFFQSGSACVQGTQCGVNSVRAANGSCVCAQGFTNYNGVCSQCAPGAFWSSSSSRCVVVCGQNAIFSSGSNACVCVAGYGLMSGQCQQCPTSFFISNGYCVTCPVNSNYNTRTNTCDCVSGHFTSQSGICTARCQTNQAYNTASQTCVCIQGLGRINGACNICPTGTRAAPDGSGCSSCAPNQQLVDGVCACSPGFALNSAQVCTICTNLPNGFLLNGRCSVCPRTMIYDGSDGCKCPDGKVLQGNVCISQCRVDQILDSNGNCFTCGANQVISNGRCVCVAGYTLSTCGICQLSCASNQFVFQGGCAVCPLNTVYKAQINGCDCPTGFYKDTFGICQQLILRPINCSSGQYFDSTRGCLPCVGSCRTCSSANVCTSCVNNGFTPNSNGVCTVQCGDGLILANQTCDTGLNFSPGCTSCQIQTGWTCTGQPSVCISNRPATTPTPTPTPTPSNNSNRSNTSNDNSSGTNNLRPLYQSGTANVNSNNVFITLKTNPTFTFPNPTEMQNFIKSSFPSGPRPTVYCSQRASPNLDTFDCLLIYPSGVPNNSFSVNFSFSYQGQSGSATVNVNPLAASNSRARK